MVKKEQAYVCIPAHIGLSIHGCLDNNVLNQTLSLMLHFTIQLNLISIN